MATAIAESLHLDRQIEVECEGGREWSGEGGRDNREFLKSSEMPKAHSTDMPTPVMSHPLIILKRFHQPGIKYLNISTRGGLSHTNHHRDLQKHHDYQ